MLYFIVSILVFALIFLGTGLYISAPKYKGPVTSHFNGNQFINPENIKPKSLGEILRWMISREQGEWTALKNTAFGKIPDERIANGVRITFINHSTFLIQTDGLNILTDPVFSERASPFSWAGPKRMRPPGIRFEDLPPIDVVLLSHNHYDHLDIATVAKLNETFHPEFVVPLGVGAFLKQHHIDRYKELDWWQSLPLRNSFAVQAVPAQHFSGRGFFDRDATLWCGYVLQREHSNIYFAGDTGYNDQTFKEIGKRCAPIDVAIIPIGAYKPSQVMSPIHCSPEEAVKIHHDLQAKRSIASHYGTFPLADDSQLEPVIDLKKAKLKYNLAEKDFMPLREGEHEDV